MAFDPGQLTMLLHANVNAEWLVKQIFMPFFAEPLFLPLQPP